MSLAVRAVLPTLHTPRIVINFLAMLVQRNVEAYVNTFKTGSRTISFFLSFFFSSEKTAENAPRVPRSLRLGSTRGEMSICASTPLPFPLLLSRSRLAERKKKHFLLAQISLLLLGDVQHRRYTRVQKRACTRAAPAACSVVGHETTPDVESVGQVCLSRVASKP